MADIIKIGISSCLLGHKVRFDAGHKKSQFISDRLGEYFNFVIVCPEIEVGMGVPRESVRLIEDENQIKMVGNKTGKDWTDKMNRYSKKRVIRKDLSDLAGFILKSKSPSCGMERVKLYKNDHPQSKNISGIFAYHLMNHFPYLPVEEEGRLNDPMIRENFIVRVFAFQRLKNLFKKTFSRKDVVQFHTEHKYLLMAHSPEYYRKLGNLVGNIHKFKPTEFKIEYEAMFMTALKYKATVKKNVNVLEHISGYLKKEVSDLEKRDIHEAIEDYHKGLTPLIVPITLINHFINKYNIEYIKKQIYLKPHPKELMLRNHC